MRNTKHLKEVSKVSAQETVTPKHIGVIMDGNGRWARKRGLVRTKGHLAGITAAKETVLCSIEENIPYLSLYIFSTENWKRPKSEVSFILSMVSSGLRKHYDFYRKNKIKIVYSGNIQNLNDKVQQELRAVMAETKDNTVITLNLAFNYGGRDEIIRAFHRYMDDTNRLATLDELSLWKYLDHPTFPPLDLVIRTGAQHRISNFMLWQIAYAELYFIDTLWPDWNKEHMRVALRFYKTQKRNFGGISP